VAVEEHKLEERRQEVEVVVAVHIVLVGHMEVVRVVVEHKLEERRLVEVEGVVVRKLVEVLDCMAVAHFVFCGHPIHHHVPKV